MQAEQAALERQIAASQQQSESEARLQEQSQVCLKPLYVFVACCECGSRVAEPQVPCHSRIHSSEVEGWGTTGVGPQRTNRPWSEGSSRAVQSKL